MTDDAALASTVRSLRNQGRAAMGAWLEHERLGYNYRMNEMSAALGVSQVSRLDEILARREAVARMYNERLAGVECGRSMTAAIERSSRTISACDVSPRTGNGPPPWDRKSVLGCEGKPLLVIASC